MKIISVIGPIGSGKSVFVNHTKKFNVADLYYHEDVEGNKWLKKEPTLENLINCQAYIIDHKKDFYNAIEDDNITLLEDASLYQDLYYVKSGLGQYEYIHSLIEEAYLALIKKFYLTSAEHIVIFIDLDPAQNIKNVKKRGRDFEQHLDLEFFTSQKEKLEEILKRFEGNFKLIRYKPDMKKFDIEDEKELETYYENVFKELGLLK